MTALPAVDVRNPAVVPLPEGTAIFATTNVTFDSKLKQTSLCAEDALNLTPKWLLVGGVRWDHIALDRTTIQNATGAADRNSPTFDPISWRAGTTWDVTQALTLYAQYTTAVSPVSSILLASIANSRFRLTKGRAYEAGFKATAWGGRASVTGAAYRIEQRDILTRDPNNSAATVQGGRQSSQGVELSAVVSPAKALRLSGGVSCTGAQYDELSELVGGVRIDRNGNRPINIPSTTVNASALYTIADKVTVGGLSPGLLFVVLGLTESALVFYTGIDAALHPVVEAGPGDLPPDLASSAWDRALATGRARWYHPGDKWTLVVTGEGGPIPARYYPASGQGHHTDRTMVWFSPDGTRIVRAEPWGGYLMSWLYQLHMALLAGDLGGQVVGWSGVAMLLLLVSGIAAWWPRGSWRKALALGSGPVDYSQKMTVAARAMAEKKAVGQRS